jgi:hypothetical protein
MELITQLGFVVSPPIPIQDTPSQEVSIYEHVNNETEHADNETQPVKCINPIDTSEHYVFMRLEKSGKSPRDSMEPITPSIPYSAKEKEQSGPLFYNYY